MDIRKLLSLVSKQADEAAPSAKKALNYGSQTAPEVLEQADELLPTIGKNNLPVEVGPSVVGRPSPAASPNIDIPDAAFKEITPTTGMDDMSWLNRMDPRLRAFAKGGAAGAATGYVASELFPYGEDSTGAGQPPIAPQAKPSIPEAAPIEKSEQAGPKTVKTDTPQIDGLDFDASSKKFDQGMAGLPKDGEAIPEGVDFRKLMEQGIAGRDKKNWEADLLRSSERLSAGLSRTKAEHGSSDIRRGQAKEAIQDAEGRIGSEQKQQQFAKAQSEMGDETKMRDPNSDISKMTTELAQKVGILKPGQSASAMSLKNAGVNLGQLLMTIEAGKARKAAAEAAAASKDTEKEAKLSQNQRKFVQGLRKEATTGVLGKQYATYSTGQRMASSLAQFAKDPSGYKDYATLMGGLKSLQGDESVVREAEVRMGMSATSAIDTAMNYLQKLQSGKMLQPEQRAQMLDTIKILTDASRQQYMHSVKPILEQASMEGVDPGLILSGSLSGAKEGSDNNSDQPAGKTRTFKSAQKPGSVVTVKSGQKYKIGPDGVTGTEI